GPVYNIEVEEDHSYTANFMAVSNCQNADISQRRKVEGIEVEPQDVVRMTVEQGCQGLAYTYNQPTIFIEFARDIGMLARKAGLINIFVSNGYDTPETVAKEEGLKYVYIRNVSGHRLEKTYCPGCGAIAIKRYGFDITGWYLGKDNKCKKCGYKLAIFGRLEQTAKENRFYSVLYHR